MKQLTVRNQNKTDEAQSTSTENSNKKPRKRMQKKESSAKNYIKMKKTSLSENTNSTPPKK